MAEIKLENIETVTIPIPLPFQRNFGVHATSHETAVRVMQRITKEQHATMSKAAATLNITLAAFIKESAYNMAKAINLKVKDKSDAQHDIRSG